MKITLAEQEAIKFNERVIDYFIIKILKIEKFFISDRSYVSDMIIWDKEDGVQINDTEWEFTSTYYSIPKDDPIRKEKKSLFDLSPEDKEKYKIVKKDVVNRDKIVFIEDLPQKTKEVFECDIDPDLFNGTFAALGFEISKKITPKKRKEIDDFFDNEESE